MARVTLLSHVSPRILRILARPVSTDLRRVGVISHFLPVNSTFMSAPFFPGTTFGLMAPAARTARCRPDSRRDAGATFSLCAGGCWGCACLPGISRPCGGLPEYLGIEEFW